MYTALYLEAQSCMTDMRTWFNKKKYYKSIIMMTRPKNAKPNENFPYLDVSVPYKGLNKISSIEIKKKMEKN